MKDEDGRFDSGKQARQICIDEQAEDDNNIKQKRPMPSFEHVIRIIQYQQALNHCTREKGSTRDVGLISDDGDPPGHVA